MNKTIMVNLDLKREDGKFEGHSFGSLKELLSGLEYTLANNQVLTLYIEFRDRNEFKKTKRGKRMYKLKGIKGA